MSHKHELGCCGYDELAYKPPTTKPIGRGSIRAVVVNFNNKRNAVPVRSIGRSLPLSPSIPVDNVGLSGASNWICPECTRLNWTVEDFGHGQHMGITRNIGQQVPPRCARHPQVEMVLRA